MKLTETELRQIFFGEPKEIDLSEEELLYWTAVHEAGRAVIARVLGLGPACGHVTIEPDEDSAGHGIIGDHYLICHVWEQQGRSRDVSTAIVGRIMAFMAGTEAEVEILGGCQGSDDDDRRQVALMLETRSLKIPGYDEDDDEPTQLYERRLRERTCGLVRRHRDKIERVAQVLLERRTLTAKDIDTVIVG